MNIGQLNKRVLLQYQTKTADGLGGNTVTWTDSCNVWAAIWPVSASEMLRSSMPSLTVTTRVRIRYMTAIRASWRIKYDSRYFSIISIINANESNEYLDLLCREVQ